MRVWDRRIWRGLPLYWVVNVIGVCLWDDAFGALGAFTFAPLFKMVFVVVAKFTFWRETVSWWTAGLFCPLMLATAGVNASLLAEKWAGC